MKRILTLFLILAVAFAFASTVQASTSMKAKDMQNQAAVTTVKNDSINREEAIIAATGNQAVRAIMNVRTDQRQALETKFTTAVEKKGIDTGQQTTIGKFTGAAQINRIGQIAMAVRKTAGYSTQ